MSTVLNNTDKNENEIIVGIDFGTSNSVISYYNKGPTILKDGVNTMIPSKIYLGDKKYFGNNIPIKETNHSNCEYIKKNFKTEISDSDSVEKKKEIFNLILLFFKYLVSLIKEKLNLFSKAESNPRIHTISFDNNTQISAVLTVPSNFNDYQRNIIMECAKLSGLNIIRLINEPTAAAFAYGINNMEDSNDSEEDNNILVFDIGGGTLDISILQLDNNFFEVVDSFGISDLGGNNFTDEIFLKVKSYFECESLDSQSESLDDSLWNKCNKAKENLSFLKKVKISMNQFNKVESIDSKEFILDFNNCKDICKNLIDRIKNQEWIKNLISKIENKEMNIKKIILVGGCSKLVIIQDLIEELFLTKPLIHHQLQHVVSLGACYYGALIKNKLSDFEDIILIDTLQLSLGVETADGNFSVIIPKNTPLPATRSKKYTTDTPGDVEVKIKVYQGEKNVASKNNLVGEISFDKVSKTTNPIINITFKVDANGIISIYVEDTKSNDSVNILIKCNMDFLKSIECDELIAKQSNESRDSFEIQKLDEEEAKIMNLCYSIKIKIENLLSNLNNDSNDKDLELNEEKYEYFSNLLNLIDNIYTEDNKPKLTIPELIKIEKELDEKYFLLINTNTTAIESTNLQDESVLQSKAETNSYYNINNVILCEKLDTIKSKIDYYLSKDLDQFKKECLIEIVYKIENLQNSKLLDQKFLDEKLNFIQDLFKEDTKDQLLELCIFLKSGIENNEIPDDENLYDKILENISIIKSDENIKDFDENNLFYSNEIQLINKICEKIFKKNK